VEHDVEAELLYWPVPQFEQAEDSVEDSVPVFFVREALASGTGGAAFRGGPAVHWPVPAQSAAA